MSEERKIISDEMLEDVVGGLFLFSSKRMIIEYSHMDGTTTTHKILDYAKAWETSNLLHAQKMPEDDIMAELVKLGYVAG